MNRVCRKWPQVLLVCLLAAGGSGCGARKASLSGRVTLDGVPLKLGSVVVQCSNGTFKVGIIESDGKYTVEDAVAGEALVAVQVPPPSVDDVAHQGGGDGAPDFARMGRSVPREGTHKVEIAQAKSSKKKKKADEDEVDIPKKYQDFKSSGFSIKLEAGSNSLDLPLRSTG